MQVPSLTTVSKNSVVTLCLHIIPNDAEVLCACIKHYVKSAEKDSSLQANIRSDDL